MEFLGRIIPAPSCYPSHSIVQGYRAKDFFLELRPKLRSSSKPGVSVRVARGWHNSEEYKPLAQLRMDATEGAAFLVEGN